MANETNAANIVVGEAVVKIGASNLSLNGAGFDDLPSVGYTQGGVEISWQPDMVDIEVDQFGDAAKVIQSKVKVMVKTTMAEGTLNNLAIAWSYDSTLGGDDIKANNDTWASSSNTVASGATRTLLFGGQNVYPYEKAIQIEGNAPNSTASTTYVRKFRTKRAISMESSTISMKRAEATVFAVSFRVLPNSADTGYEYGKIIDMVPPA
jgi:hypothetical protein